MKPGRRWTLTVLASRDDGALLFLRPVSGLHAHIREMVDSDMALLEFIGVVPRSKAEELLYASAIDESQDPHGDQWQIVNKD